MNVYIIIRDTADGKYLKAVVDDADEARKWVSKYKQHEKWDTLHFQQFALNNVDGLRKELEEIIEKNEWNKQRTRERLKRELAELDAKP